MRGDAASSDGKDLDSRRSLSSYSRSREGKWYRFRSHHAWSRASDPSGSRFAGSENGHQGGHRVSVFLAGDAVQLIRDQVLDSLQGLGTGSSREHFDGMVSGGANVYISGMSSKVCGISEDDLSGKNTEMRCLRPSCDSP